MLLKSIHDVPLLSGTLYQLITKQMSSPHPPFRWISWQCSESQLMQSTSVCITGFTDVGFLYASKVIPYGYMTSLWPSWICFENESSIQSPRTYICMLKDLIIFDKFRIVAASASLPPFWNLCNHMASLWLRGFQNYVIKMNCPCVHRMRVTQGIRQCSKPTINVGMCHRLYWWGFSTRNDCLAHILFCCCPDLYKWSLLIWMSRIMKAWHLMLV